MSAKIHPAVKGLKKDMEKGKLSRREFIRYSTLLGVSAFTATQMAGLSWTAKAFAGKVKKGGIIKIASPVQKVTHPAQFSWISGTNMLRQVVEYHLHRCKQCYPPLFVEKLGGKR